MRDGRNSVTILDVASMAGVSPSTVTHALNGKRPVKDETKKRIKMAIDALGYVPSWNASRLKGRFSGVIGCIASDISDSFVNQIVKGIEHGLIRGEETLIFVSLFEFDGDFEAAFRFLLSHDIDGLLICYHIPPDKVMAMRGGIPVVSLNMELSDHVSVIVNSESGGRRAADHLYDVGVRHPAVICGPEDRASAQTRLDAFLRRIGQLGLQRPEDVYFGEYDVSHGYEACQAILRSGYRFDGLFAENDYIAAGAITALSEHGIRVPEDVKVVGFDNREFSSFWNPPITTFNIPLQDIGMIGIGLLRSLIASSTTSIRRRCVMEPDLIVRRSTFAG